jgi:hypothetical protein
MVRSVIAFAVVALGAAAVLAQNPETDNLEYREYDSDEILAREILDESTDVVAREELFANLSAREVEQVMEYLRAVAEPTPAASSQVLPTPSPSATPAVVKAAAKDATVTVTTTLNPSPTACTAKDLKKAKQHKKVVAARKTLKELNEKKKTGELTAEEKAARKKAMKVVKRARARNVKKAKKIVGKCRKALRKAGIGAKSKCVEGKKDACQAALSKVGVSEDKCVAAEIYLEADKELKAAKKAAKKATKKGKGSKESSEKVKASKKKLAHAKAGLKAKVAPTPTVGADGVPTVLVVKERPTCTTDAAGPTATSAAKARRELVEGMDDIFAREYDFESLD